MLSTIPKVQNFQSTGMLQQPVSDRFKKQNIQLPDRRSAPTGSFAQGETQMAFLSLGSVTLKLLLSLWCYYYRYPYIFRFPHTLVYSPSGNGLFCRTKAVGPEALRAFALGFFFNHFSFPPSLLVSRSPRLPVSSSPSLTLSKSHHPIVPLQRWTQSIPNPKTNPTTLCMVLNWLICWNIWWLFMGGKNWGNGYVSTVSGATHPSNRV